MTTVWFFRVTIELVTPGGVAKGAEAISGQVDAPLERDPDSHPWVPGTSLAGSLRAHAEAEVAGQQGDRTMVRRLFGHVRQNSDGTERPTSSQVRVLGTAVHSTGSVVQTHQAAIDRHRRAARNATLRSGEFLPAGSTITVWLSTETEELQTLLLRWLPSWQPIIGRGRTNGYGRTHITEVRWGALDRSTRQGVHTWLTQGGPALADAVAITAVPVAAAPPTAASVTVTASVVEALMIRAGQPVVRPGEPTVTKIVRRGGVPTVPAASLRGIVRSQLEFILRSVGAAVCAESAEAGQCGRCWTCEVFGFVGRTASHGTPRQQPRRGRVRFGDQPISRTSLKQRHRNSIDRFTGGAADERLWTEEVVESGQFAITIDHEPLPADGDQEIDWWAEFTELLPLVWRDVDEGQLRLGGGTTTGHGRLAVSREPGDPQELPRAYATVGRIVARGVTS